MNARIDNSLVIAGAPEIETPDPPQGDVYEFPCSVVQRTCWFLEQMSPGTPVNNIAVRFRLNGKLEPELLLRALNAISQRHEVLRTRFIVRDGEPMQLIEPELPVDLPVLDLLAEPDGAEREAAAEARLPFDIEKGPLWRTRLLRTGPQEYILLITIHHIVADGWSIGILIDELGQIYGSMAEGSVLSLPPLPIQYADYASWQKEALSGKLEAELEHWKLRLRDFEPLCILTDLKRPAKAQNRGTIRSLVLRRDVTDSLKKLSDQQGCTLFMTMLAAFQALMWHESGQSDVVVRTQTAGRGRVELEPLIGWFVNSVLLRSQIPENGTFLDLLEAAQQGVLDALEHQDVPFEQVVEVVRPRQDQSHLPPFPVNFIFQRDFVKTWARGGVTLTAAPSAAAGTFVDLNFFLVERADGWRASVDVNTDVFRPATGDLFLKNYQTILETVAGDPRVLLSDIPFPPPRRGVQAQKLALRPVSADRLQPRDELESELLAIWKNVLGRDSLEVDTNFFDVGGHSLLAASMLSIVQKRFGHRINLSGLFVEPTVLAMARALRLQFAGPSIATVAPPPQPESAPYLGVNVIPVQPFGEAPPLFMVGGDHWFRPLANRLGSHQPFLGLSLMSYEQRAQPTSFDEISSDLMRVLLNIRKSGPFVLSGWCVDGSIAFEVAQKLIQAHHEVALVVLIDAINPAYRRELKSGKQRLRRALKRTKSLASEVVQKNGFGVVEHAVSGLAELGSRALGVIAPGQPKSAANLEIERSDPDRQEFRRILYRAEAQYTPSPISCPVVLLRSAVSEFQDSDLGWRRVALGGLEIVEIPADHIGMFREPQVEHLASALGQRIETALYRKS